MRSDWSKIASYVAIITWREEIMAGELNFKLAATCFVIRVISKRTGTSVENDSRSKKTGKELGRVHRPFVFQM